jgi:hypothetical protein
VLPALGHHAIIVVMEWDQDSALQVREKKQFTRTVQFIISEFSKLMEINQYYTICLTCINLGISGACNSCNSGIILNI